jgi:hypothetical protein
MAWRESSAPTSISPAAIRESPYESDTGASGIIVKSRVVDNPGAYPAALFDGGENKGSNTSQEILPQIVLTQ